MRRGVEALTFVGLAAGLHLAAVAVELPEDEGASAAGEAGDAQVSIAAAAPQVSAMVEEWEAPPEVTEAAERVQQTPPPPTDVSPTPPTSEPAPESAPSTDMPDMPELAQAPPDAVDVPEALPEPPKPEPETQEYPEPEPQPEEAEPEENRQISEVRPRGRPDRPDPPPEPQPEREEPREQPAPPQAPSQAQQASGAGGGANAGSTERAQASTADPARQQSLKSRWGAQIRAQIERRKQYPSAARGASGAVVIRITVDRAGALRGASLASSSGHRALDRAAVRAVQGAGRFPAAPSELAQSSFTFSLPMRFDR